MGKIESEDKKTLCTEHQDNQTIWECDICGKKMCKDCTAVAYQYKVYCDKCIEKLETTPIGKTVHPAPLSKRLGGFVIDTIVLLSIYVIFLATAYFFFNPTMAVSLINVAFVFYVIYFMIFTYKAGQTPGQMAMEIETRSTQNKRPNLLQAFLRHIIGFLIGFFYSFGLIAYFNKLSAGMGTQHFTSLFEFLNEYHRFGISTNMKFLYSILFVFLFIDAFFLFITKSKNTLHDFWSRTKVILSL